MTSPASELILARLPALHPKSIDLSLGRVERLLAAVGHPERRLPPVVHIAGTNGKGSTLAMLAAMLQAGGQPRLQHLASQQLGPVATFIAAHHIGDPIGRADAWRPWLRRRAMQRKLTEQKRALAAAGLQRPDTGRIKQVV